MFGENRTLAGPFSPFFPAPLSFTAVVDDEMPGRLRGRKRKGSQSRGSAKACPGQRGCMSSVDSKACVSRSGISCECEQWSSHSRCSASPQPPPCEDKENQEEPLCCEESMDCDDFSKTLFPDDDSNQVLPVEQFFGNMDTVQDFPQRPSAPSTSAQRAQRRRRYYAPEDSDQSEEGEEEEGGAHTHSLDCPEQRH